MSSFKKGFLGMKINNTRIVPLVLKIVVLFILFILVSNFSTNYINLILNRSELIKLVKEILIKDLKEIYNFSSNQYEIYLFNDNYQASIDSMEKKALSELKYKRSMSAGVKSDGTYLFQSTRLEKEDKFSDTTALDQMMTGLVGGTEEGVILFNYHKDRYYGIYKYNQKWNCFIIRAEELSEFNSLSQRVFINVSVLIVLITLACAVVGIFVLRRILRFVDVITSRIMEMIHSQKLELIDLKHATNDDVTFLGIAFNSLSSTINNLMSIFLKFVNRDIADKAYKEKVIRLEGRKLDLTMLFSDIKSFTYMTETLGIDIIKLLNIHYESAIHYIHLHEGTIGSIIGDALLAVFGSFEDPSENKSMQSIRSAYDIQKVTADLRKNIMAVKDDIEKNGGTLSEEELKVFKAVLIEVGVGIDGGDVFYGTIGSSQRMTNTVIGDNVNSASRLEGLTRIYKVPVICSEYVKNDVEKNVPDHGLVFIEIDQVQVKGKTIGKKIFYPLFQEMLTDELTKSLEQFSLGLVEYYMGRWNQAHKYFVKCNLPLAEVFIDRTKNYKCPEDWSGIWTMKTK